MAKLLAELPDRDASDRVPTATDLSELEPPSKKKKTGKCSSENEGGVDDSRSNDDRRTTCWVWSDDCSWAACPVRSPSSENEGGVDDSRSNDDGRTTCWVWPDDCSWAACLVRSPSSENEGGVDDSRSNDDGRMTCWVWSDDSSWAACPVRSPSSENEGGVDDSRSNGDGWMPDDPRESGQLALFPMELEPPFSGKESNEINGVEGSCEVRSVAGKCRVLPPKAVQLLSASSSNSDYLDVNSRMECRDPPPLLLWLRDMFSQPIHYPPVGTIFGNLKPENVLMMTDRLFCGQLSYIKKNNMDPFLVKSTPEAEDLFSRLLKKNPESRLEEREVVLHPFSWRSNVKLRFLQEMNAGLLSKSLARNQDLLTELQRNEPLIFYGNWLDKLDPEFKTYILDRKEKYDFSSVMELVRFMRNKRTHRDELPENIKDLFGPGDEGFYNYFDLRFPRLFMKLYGAAFRFCREEEWFEVFLRENFPEYFESDAL